MCFRFSKGIADELETAVFQKITSLKACKISKFFVFSQISSLIPENYQLISIN